jgi:hypothetical protein
MSGEILRLGVDPGDADRRVDTNYPRRKRRLTMRYLLLLAGDESVVNTANEGDEGMSPEYAEFIKDLAERGVLQGGERLRPTADATTVRVRDGEVLSTDGPFAETKEQLAGYFMVDCKNLDEAIEVASLIPGAKFGSVEVRPIWEM